MGGKKRKSINTSSSSQHGAGVKHTLSGEDSDYGVLSDPDEIVDSKYTSELESQMQKLAPEPHTEPIPEPIPEPTPTLTPEPIPEPTLEGSGDEVVTNKSDVTNEEETATKIDDDTIKNVTSIPEDILYNKSLELLTIYLEKDPVFSNKIVHTTFLSFVILAMEIDDSVTNIFSRTLSPESYESSNVERIIEYMIKNHSLTPEVEQYTSTMMQLGIVTNIMKGLIGFNLSLMDKNEKKPSVIRPYLKEVERLDKEKHNEKNKKKRTVNNEKSPSPSSSPSPSPSSSPSPFSSPSPSSSPNKFIQFWRNITCCCRRRRSNSMLKQVDVQIENNNMIMKSKETQPIDDLSLTELKTCNFII